MSERGGGEASSRQSDIREYVHRGIGKAFSWTPIGQGIAEYRQHRGEQAQPPRQTDLREYMQQGLGKAFSWTPIGQGVTEYQQHQRELTVSHHQNQQSIHDFMDSKSRKSSESSKQSSEHLEAPSSVIQVVQQSQHHPTLRVMIPYPTQPSTASSSVIQVRPQHIGPFPPQILPEDAQPSAPPYYDISTPPRSLHAGRVRTEPESVPKFRKMFKQKG